MIRFTAEPRLLMAANTAFYQSQQLALMGGGITSYVLRREPPQPPPFNDECTDFSELSRMCGSNQGLQGRVKCM